MTPDRSGLFLPKKRGSRGTGAPCKQDRGINAEYPSKHHRKLVWTKLANDYLTLTAEPPELNCSSVYGTINKIVNICLFQICDRCDTGRIRE
jgi:hypothetical protein